MNEWNHSVQLDKYDDKDENNWLIHPSQRTTCYLLLYIIPSDQKGKRVAPATIVEFQQKRINRIQELCLRWFDLCWKAASETVDVEL